MKKRNILINFLGIALFGLMLGGCEDATIPQAEPSISVDHPTLNMFVGDVVTILASPTTTTFAWESIDPSVATVSQSGEVTAVGDGQGEIVVSSGDMRLSIPVSVEVKIPATSVTVSQTVLGMNPDNLISLKTTVLPTNYNEKLSMKWSTENPAIATVSEFGDVTAIADGSTNIVLTATGEQTFTITIPIHVNSIWYNPPHILSNANPCIIWARDFDYGGQDVAFWADAATQDDKYRTDIPAGQPTPRITGGRICYIASGEWYAYTVYVEDEGDYICDIENSGNDGTYHYEVDDTDPTPNKVFHTAGTGGWGTYKWLSTNDPSKELPVLHLTTGYHQLKFKTDAPNYNFQKIQFTYKN